MTRHPNRQPLRDLRPTGLLATFRELELAVLRASRDVYQQRLVSLIVFGSCGRRAPRPDSDIDLLLVVEALPHGRMARVEEFGAVEDRIVADLAQAKRRGVVTRLSPVFKTPEEAERGSPLFLDLVEDARVLYDRGGFFAGVLDALRQRLAELGARRVWRGNAWYWDLKPDYVPGDVFEI